MEGVIVEYDPEKGYGFILIEAGKRIFFHVSDCLISEDLIQFGRTVSFDMQKYMKGDRTMVKAVNVRLSEEDQGFDNKK